jgi:hypothetical protein
MGCAARQEIPITTSYGGTEMKRIDALKAKLKAAKSELTIRYRQYHAAERGLARVLNSINDMEKKIEKTNLA